MNFLKDILNKLKGSDVQDDKPVADFKWPDVHIGKPAAELGANVHIGRLVADLEGHGGSVNSLAWSPDGTRLFSASNDGSLRVWNPESKEQEARLRTDGGVFRAVAWSPDEQFFATGEGVDGRRGHNRVRIWNIALDTIRELDHTDKATNVAWSACGKWLAASGLVDDLTIRIWEANSGETVRLLKGHETFVESLAWSPDGKYIASGDADDVVRVWDGNTGREVTVLENAGGYIGWSSDGRLVSAKRKETLTVRDTTSWQPMLTMQHQGEIYGVAWSPDGKHIAGVGKEDIEDGLRIGWVWDASSGELQEVLEVDYPYDTALSLAWHPSESILATGEYSAYSGTGDPRIRIWELNI